MSDFATLILKADATGMVAGEQALDSIAAKGAQAETTVTKAMRNVGESGKQAGRGLGQADAAAKRTAASMGQAAQQSQRAANETRAAAGHTANLTAQFNDIAVMMAAGQSPIQLAMQQGTQINQVMAQLGGGTGAVRALGAAFMSMVNPVSLATLGIIALGAYGVQALASLLPAAKNFDDQMDELADVVGQYSEASKFARMSTDDLAKAFGLAAPEAQRFYATLKDIADLAAEQSFRSAWSTLTAEGGFDATDRMASMPRARRAVASTFNMSTAAHRINDPAITDFLGLVQEVEQAERLEDRLSAINGLMQQAQAMAAADGKQTDEELALLNQIAAVQTQLIDLQAAKTIGSVEEVEAAKEYTRSLAERASFAGEELSRLTGQAEINRLIAQYGKDSEEVAAARAEAEREAYAATLESKGVTGLLADVLMDAYDATVSSASATDDWAAAMARVNAQLAGAYSLISAIGGGMVQRAGVNAANAVLDAGGSSIEAEKARRRAEERTRITNEANTAAGFRSPDSLDAELAEMERQWAVQDEYDARLTGVRDAEREARKKPRKTPKDRLDGYERSVMDIQSETEAFLRQADAMAKVVAAGGDWERALAVIEEEQKLLNAAQKAGVDLSDEAKANIHQMAEAYVDAEQKLESMREATDRGRDAMQDLFGSITDGSDGAVDALKGLLEQIAKVQIASGMMGLLGGTSWGGALTTGLGKLLTPSFDGGGYTGDGSRSGGLDGKGGFLGILHPRETVTDHTKGQHAGGTTRVEIVPSQYFDARVTELADASSAKMGQAVSASIPGRIQQYQRDPRKR